MDIHFDFLSSPSIINTNWPRYTPAAREGDEKQNGHGQERTVAAVIGIT
jgi:hypothetical protein